MKEKKAVLILNSYYLPGYKSGGPQRTVENICGMFSKSSDIYLITLNHDFGNKIPYNIETNRWININGLKVMYVSDRTYGFRLLHTAYRFFDTIYTCGLFAGNTIKILIIHRILSKKKIHLYVAPMGVLSDGAIQVKRIKKRFFLLFCCMAGMFKNIIWSFSSDMEKQDAEREIGKHWTKNCIIAEDLPRKVDFKSSKRNMREKEKKMLKIVFLSRISPQKNLLLCAEILKMCKDVEIDFNIYGIIEDSIYWERCRREFGVLPPNITCKYKGEVKPDDVMKVLLDHDVFLFPTKGENYGHVIFEALSAGCVPVISDKTIWQDLTKKNCGRICSVTAPEEFAVSLRELACMEAESFITIKNNAIDYAEDRYNRTVKETGYREVFM